MAGKRTDANHAEIRTSLRNLGYQVIDTHEVGRGFPDLLVVSRNRTIVLLEVKAGAGKLNELERSFHDSFEGPCRVVRSVDEAVNTIRSIDEEGNHD